MTAPDSDQNPSNIRALGAIYSAMLFEELKTFRTVDKLVELFQGLTMPQRLITRQLAAKGPIL